MTKLYIIYEIRPLNKELLYSYVGSTKNFIKRKSNHKTDCNNLNSSNHNVKIYNYIRENGGWTEFEMVALEEFECDTKIQARIQEQVWIDKMKNKLNMVKAYCSAEERIERKKELRKNYSADKKEIIKQIRKERILCPCGTEYNKSNKYQHILYKYHLAFMEQLNKKEIITECIDVKQL
jgi:hypothetical protein